MILWRAVSASRLLFMAVFKPKWKVFGKCVCFFSVSAFLVTCHYSQFLSVPVSSSSSYSFFFFFFHFWLTPHNQRLCSLWFELVKYVRTLGRMLGTSLSGQMWKNVWKTSGSSESSQQRGSGRMGVFERNKEEEKEEKRGIKGRERVTQEISLWVCPPWCQKQCGNIQCLSFPFHWMWIWQLSQHRRKEKWQSKWSILLCIWFSSVSPVVNPTNKKVMWAIFLNP